MNTKAFLLILVLVLVLGGSIGGAFAGGVALGKSQNEEPLSSRLPSTGGAIPQLGQDSSGLSLQDLEQLRQRFASGDLSQEEILASAEGAGLELDALTRDLFPDGVSAGDPLVDLKLIAYELHEIAAAVRGCRTIEVDGICGLKDVAALYSVFESGRAGRAVRLSEVETCQVYAYQEEIDAALGIA